jgi:hypothetical protein
MSLGASARAMFEVLCLVCVGHVMAGCSSLDEDTPDHLDFDLPKITWSVDPDDSQWRSQPPPDVAVANYVCAGPLAVSTDCCAPPFDCQRYPMACDPVSKLCALTFDVQVVESVDLSAQPVVAAARDRVFAKVEVLSLSTQARLPQGLPIQSVTLFLGPDSLTEAADPAATLLGQAPLDAPPHPMALTQSAQQAFSTFARTPKIPFSMLLFVHAVVANGSRPEGELELTLTGRLRAYY